ncbi:methylglyoxal synthase, partial [Dehalococcoides mccartyi]
QLGGFVASRIIKAVIFLRDPLSVKAMNRMLPP